VCKYKPEVKLRAVAFLVREYREIARLEGAAFAAARARHHANTASHVRTLMERLPLTTGVAAVDPHEAIRGWVCYARRPFHTVELMALAVHPDWQDQGIGRQLLGPLLAECRQDPRQKLGVFLPDDLMPLAHEFFKHFKFRYAGRQPIERGDEPWTRMIFQITRPVTPLGRKGGKRGR
jgi:GNAT superfamily N-acetyltransferase